MSKSLNVVNLENATFECIYGRGCDGICCREGEPPVGPSEAATIDAVLQRVLPMLRPEARAMIDADGFLGEPHANGEPKLKVSDGWCVCSSTRAACCIKSGPQMARPFRYKPSACSLFPLYKGDDENWHVRQWGHDGEEWDLFCLDPKHSRKRAADTLGPEMELAQKFDGAPANVETP